MYTCEIEKDVLTEYMVCECLWHILRTVLRNIHDFIILTSTVGYEACVVNKDLHRINLI